MTTYFSRNDWTGPLRELGIPINAMADLDPLIRKIGQKRIVMLGEASHGTHEYYTWRSHITRRLVEEYGFRFVAVEGDWPDCYALNRYVSHHASAPGSATDNLHSFDRWPTWMWGNWEIAAFVEWMRRHNKGKERKEQVGFYGLDVYSLWDSLECVVQYLQKNDPDALKAAHEAIRCFEPYKEDEGASYGYAARMVPELCQDEVIGLLQTLTDKRKTPEGDTEPVFSAEQNALIAVNAERYYRAMISGGPHSWNVRDSHMMETLNRLLEFQGPESKAIIWAHNTHIGDARATDMADEGMFNIGQLARQQYGNDAVALIGFGSYEGSVIAGSAWGADLERKEVPEAREDSWEFQLHTAGGNRLLLLDQFPQTPFHDTRIGHRAIGVVYRPAYERYGNYVQSIIGQR
ncbi:MAG TPA: erythromycin esterase family protein, partial [Chitinophagaceae bacterium]|nr:erythromycin esterase family protein [Chitinophagaceae bacterium]